MGKYIRKLACVLVSILTIFTSCITYIQTVKAEGEDNILAYAYKIGTQNDPVAITSFDDIARHAALQYTVVLNQDIEISNPFYVQGTWTINMNGHKIYRNLGSAVNNGEIFNLNAYAVLNLLGTKDEKVTTEADVENTLFTYYGYRKDDSTSAFAKDELTVTAGGLITGGYTNNSAGAIYLHHDATVVLNNVAVNGNTNLSSNTSGSIYADGSNCTINLINSHVDHNYSAKDGGAIANSKNSTTTIEMNNSTIDYNISKYMGGGIAANGKIIINGDISNYNSSVSHNYSGSTGGGIYLTSSSDNSEIRRIIIGNNYANSPCGGLYINSENAKIADCTIKDNTAKGFAGGVFVDDDGSVFIDVKITGNKTIKGADGKDCYAGGIYVFTRYDITMNGRCVVENNYNSLGKVDNVYLDDAWIFGHAYIKGRLLDGAHVGLNCDSSRYQKLGISIEDYIDGRYFLDNPENLHLYYDKNAKELYQDTGESRKYTLTVNGVDIGDYYQGKTVTISDNNEDQEKIFLNWDTTHAEGLDYIDIPKEEQVFTITMPGNDVSIDAKYLDRLTSLKLTINEDSPTPGSYLPYSIKYTYGPDEQSRWSWDIEWYEVDGETMTPTSGNAKYDTTYAFKFQLAKDISKGLVFSDSMKPEDITIKFGDGTTITASSVSIDEAGTLTIISEPLTTGSKTITVNSFEAESITVQEGITKQELIEALPSTAIGVDTENNKDIYNVDKEHITDEMLSSLISEDAVIAPDGGSAIITLPIVKPENVTFAEDAEFNVTVNVTETTPITVETPTVTKGSGTYSGTSLKFEASTTTEDATIYYTIGSGETQTYDPETGITLTTSPETASSYFVNIWAEKDGSISDKLHLWYILDGRTQKTITINCSDTSLVPEGEEAWSDSVIKSYYTGTRVTVYAPTYTGRAFQKWVYTKDGQTTESTELYFTFNPLNEDETIEAIYNPIMTTISFNVPYPQAKEDLATKEEISVIATLAGKTTDITKYFDLDNLSWLPSDEIADYDTSYTIKLPILHNIEGSKFALADKLVVMVNGNTDKRLIVNLDSTRENAYVSFPETEAKPIEPTPTPTATSETKKKDSGWDDGGPFTTDTCGNVYDRWNNLIYEANGCNVGGYNLVQTDTK